VNAALLHQPSHDVQHVECPAALLGFDFADGFEPGVTGANLGGVGWQTGGNDWDGYLDNVRMSAAIPAQIQSPLLAGTNYTFNFSTVSGQSYTVQQNTNLATTNWIFCTNIIGNGSLYQFQTPVSSNHQQFFRVSAP
jgi:hypothetical protein